MEQPVKNERKIGLGSGLLDFAGLDRFNGYPHPFDLPIR
jgi:hypothetical protein